MTRKDFHDFAAGLQCQLLRCDRGVEPLAVLPFDAIECLAPVTQGDARSCVGASECGLHGAVTATHHQNIAVAVLIGIEQSIHHLVQRFARDTKLSRCAAATDRQQNRSGLDAAARCGHPESVIADRLDGGHLMPKADLQLRASNNAQPEGQQLFLADFHEAHRADDGQIHRMGHGDLVARIVQHRSTQRVFLLDQDVTQAVLDGGQASGDSRRTSANDHDIGIRASATIAGNGLHGLSSLFGSFANQAHTAKFASDVDAAHVGLEGGLHQRDIDAAPLGAKDQLDRIKWTGGVAGAVSNTGAGIDQNRFASNQAQGVFRARVHAGPRADTQIRVDHRMQACWLAKPNALGILKQFAIPTVASGLPNREAQNRHGDRQQIDQCQQVVRRHFARLGGSAKSGTLTGHGKNSLGAWLLPASRHLFVFLAREVSDA
ncbi:MAG: hypothetical protein BWZ07_03196 [Alphaproteobacteria bacterium ADurb.BinA280]|nr:MAG: hypothetical protein BWZ07_03196 [Alphaproteobacteria bacterium ADurb.BinA280]